MILIVLRTVGGFGNDAACCCRAFVVLVWMSVCAGAVDFEKDVQPIFRDRCIDCHGADEQNSQFRLDRLSVMLSGGNSGEPAIVPGKTEASYLLKLVKREEPGWEMPPDEPLSDDEIGLIENWIADGAAVPENYGPAKPDVELDHWSFRPITRARDVDGIDGFIELKLQEHGLQCSQQAPRHVLIRRLFLVMLGIPPTPEQVAEFESDPRDDAWQRLVETVLASPQYGERWASHWLDLVRFGETDGFETNRERPSAWHYRDWVIQSLNDDKPYDQFVREQIAGDALGVDVATGFLVAGPNDIVKGKDPKLGLVQRMNELDDMINTTGTAFLGLTTGCARCHNHKFDPISQRDYYSMQAVFAGVQHGERPLPLSDEARQRLMEVNAEIADLTQKLEQFIPNEPLASTKTNAADADQERRPAVNAKRNVERVVPTLARFVRFTIEKTSGAQACIDELEIYSGGENVALASVGATASSSGDFQHPLHKLEHINDGRYGNARSWISSSDSGGWVQIELTKPVMIDRIVWGRDRQSKYSDRLATAYRIESATVPDQWTLLASSADRRPLDPAQTADQKYQFVGVSKDLEDRGRRWLKQLESSQALKAKLEESQRVYAGTFSQPGPTYRLYRGEPGATREMVGPDTIQVFARLDLTQDAPEQSRRLAFADWITSKENPLTARVIVNRLWQFHFGTGIVDTPSDFGTNGAPPSHPELLDWLSSELIENRWSLKHIHRLILNSRAWRQDSRPNRAALEVDANSRLLWRFPPRRCEAETIRDSILTVSGKLNLDNRGGPGFSAFAVQLENVRHYHPKDKYGPEDWRRMIYMTKVRQEKDQVFGVFDCPDASMVVPKRSRSTTPLQALSLLNSNFVMQQAEIFAKRLTDQSESTSEMVVHAWRYCFSRDPTPEELADSESFIADQGLTQFTRAMLNANEFVFIP
ncbi:MAG: DUF1553 domain-containing protein [Planctomycetales bacterium]|nr:DUF1553 domain-containing protein [Planctomycetales bacterium]